MPPPTTSTSKVRRGERVEVADHATRRRGDSIVSGVATIDDVRDVLGAAHPRSRDHAAIRSARAGSSTISISIISRSSITCCGSSTSTAIAAARCSRSAAAPASIWRGSPRAARRSTGVDLAASAIDLARANFAQQGLDGRLPRRRRRAAAVPRRRVRSGLRARRRPVHRRTRSGWSTSAAASSSPAARPSSRSTTGSRG